MALGDKKGALTGNANSITNPAVLSGSVAVVVGDLVFGVVGQQTNLTATTTITDNLGNTYAYQNAGTDAGVATGRPFWGRITVAGTLTTINCPATASTNDWAGRAVVIEGPFQVNPLDANPANITSDTTSPFTCPTTGTLAQTPEVVIGWGAADGNSAWSATSPNLLDGNTNNSTNIKVAIGYQLVTATTDVAPAFTAAANPGACVLGTASFKAVMAGTSAQTLKRINQSASGSEVFTGTSAQALKHVTQSATGIMQPSGTSAQVLPHAQQSATGAEVLTGTSAQALPNLEQSASGAETFTGTSAQTLPNLEQAASGTHTDPAASGTAAQTLPPVDQAAIGTEAFTGSAAQMLPSVDQSATGIMQPSGTAASLLANIEQTASGAETFTATAAQTLPNVEQSASGLMHPSGSAASALPNVEQSASGTQVQNLTGSGSSILHAITQAGAGIVAFNGSGAQMLAAIVQTASGLLLVIGASETVLPKLRQAGIGVVANPIQRPIAAMIVRATIGSAGLAMAKGESGVISSTASANARIEVP